MPDTPVAATVPRALVLLGQPVAQSLSPRFQTAALRALHLDVSYTARDVAPSEIGAVLDACRQSNTAGNVTMPHKSVVYAAADRLTSRARKTGAVNTFWWDSESLVGHNTDVDGILATVQALCPNGIAGDVVLLGAGGSAAAVLVTLGEMPTRSGQRVHVVARDEHKADALIRRVGAADAAPRALAGMDWSAVRLVINATPVGMRDHDPLPLDPSVLNGDCAVFDLVYRQQGTAFVQAARARGLAAEDGLRMLVEQGASAFACWFNTPAPREVMWHALGHPVPPTLGPRA